MFILTILSKTSSGKSVFILGDVNWDMNKKYSLWSKIKDFCSSLYIKQLIEEFSLIISVNKIWSVWSENLKPGKSNQKLSNFALIMWRTIFLKETLENLVDPKVWGIGCYLWYLQSKCQNNGWKACSLPDTHNQG